jgi:hypothetical protein
VQERTADLDASAHHFAGNHHEQKNLEEQLRHAQKMEKRRHACGRLFAHDFNNILNVINGYATLIGQDRSATPQIKASLKNYRPGNRSRRRLVRQLLTVIARKVGDAFSGGKRQRYRFDTP